MKVTIDEDVCTQCGKCVDICPDVFEMGDISAFVVVEDIPAETEDLVREAIESCPVECIHVED